MKYFRWVAYLVLFASLMSCAANQAMISPNDRDRQLADKLDEISGRINSLSDDVGQIKKVILSLQGGREAPPAITSIDLDDDPVRGNAAARVAIVEFSDYQCPFCGRFHARTLPAIKKDYIDSGKVSYIFRDFPLDFHPQAKSAAIAANCAGEQGAYWEMHDRLFTNQNRLGADLYQEIANEIKIDPASFKACLTDEKHADEVGKDFAYGKSLGIDGTPTFFVGRIDGKRLVDVRQIVGAQPPAVFAQVIEAMLKSVPVN